MEIIIPFAKLNPEALIFQTVHLCSFPISKVLTEMNGDLTVKINVTKYFPDCFNFLSAL